MATAYAILESIVSYISTECDTLESRGIWPLNVILKRIKESGNSMLYLRE